MSVYTVHVHVVVKLISLTRYSYDYYWVHMYMCMYHNLPKYLLPRAISSQKYLQSDVLFVSLLKKVCIHLVIVMYHVSNS